MAQVNNIFAFNLLVSIDQGDDPARLANVTLSDFLARLPRRSSTPRASEPGWVYDAAVNSSAGRRAIPAAASATR